MEMLIPCMMPIFGNFNDTVHMKSVAGRSTVLREVSSKEISSREISSISPGITERVNLTTLSLDMVGRIMLEHVQALAV